MTRTVRATAILVAAVLIALLLPAGVAEAAPAKTPHSCKVALRDAGKVFTIVSGALSEVGPMIKLIPVAAQAGAEGDTAGIEDVTTQVEGFTAKITAANDKLTAIEDEYKSARDACLAG